MTLHTAIEKVLRTVGRAMTTREIATLLNSNKWYQKKDGSEITAFQIHGRTRNYPEMFNRNGQVVSLAGVVPEKISRQSGPTIRPKPKSASNNSKKMRDRDEDYVLDLCDKVLGLKCTRQHKFDFLLGDPNAEGRAARLPVDGYYSGLNLVVEYRERQHTEPVSFFDKKNVFTVSGVHRGEQRKIYDERRREVLPKQGIYLIEISYSDFEFDQGKRIVRSPVQDEYVIRKMLNRFV